MRMIINIPRLQSLAAISYLLLYSFQPADLTSAYGEKKTGLVIRMLAADRETEGVEAGAGRASARPLLVPLKPRCRIGSGIVPIDN